MLNHANPASESGWKIYVMYCCLSPATHPPPCTSTAAGNGPTPSGTCASIVSRTPSTSENCTFLKSAAPAANQNATTNVGHTEPHARHFVENRPPRGNWPSHKMALHHVRCYVVHESTLERASTLARVCRGVSRN